MKRVVDTYLGLRNQVLSGSRSKFGLPNGSNPDEPWGLVMDWGVPNGTATVVAISDGSASIYFSSGGGFIGGGQSHESIRNAAKQTIAAAKQAQSLMRATTACPLPEKGQVVFYALTDAGTFSATVSEEELRVHRSPFSKLSDAAQGIVTEYRLIDQKKLKSDSSSGTT